MAEKTEFTTGTTDIQNADSPERIMRDLMQTEKEIASETLLLLRSRFEKEKTQWESHLQEKQRLILELQAKNNESSIKISSLQEQLDEEAQKQIDQLRLLSHETEARKLSDAKKWQLIEDEIKNFRETAAGAQNKLISERDRIIGLKKTFEYNENLFKEHINSKEEEIMQLKELSLKKEEAYLRDKSLKEEEIHLLHEQLKNLNETISGERQYNAKITEEKDKSIFDLQQGLQSTMIQLTAERQAAEKYEGKINDLQKAISKLEDDNKKIGQSFEEERLSLHRTLREEQTSFDKFKQEASQREDTLKKETAEQIGRLAKSGEIIEQQFNEEQRLRKIAESRFQQKEAELQQILKQNDEIASDWKKIIASERDTWQKRQGDVSLEFERLKQAKEEEITKLHQKINALLSEIEQGRKHHFTKKKHVSKSSHPASTPNNTPPENQ